MNVHELREWWLTALESEGAARATLQTYRAHSDGFLKHLGDGEPSSFSVRAYPADYRRDHAPVSLQSVFISLRAWLRFCVRDGLLPETALRGLRAPKHVESPKQVYSQGQLQALSRVLEAERSPLGLRDYALCAVLLDGGLRVSEACNLTLDGLQDGAVLVAVTKSRRPRTMPLGQRAQRALGRYLAGGRPRLRPKCERMFLTQGGGAMTRNTVRLLLGRLSMKVGFHLTAHRSRHTWMTTLLRRGCDLETLRRLGGWPDYTMLLTTHTSLTATYEQHRRDSVRWTRFKRT